MAASPGGVLARKLDDVEGGPCRAYGSSGVRAYDRAFAVRLEEGHRKWSLDEYGDAPDLSIN